MFKNNKYVQWTISIQASLIKEEEGSTTKYYRLIISGRCLQTFIILSTSYIGGFSLWQKLNITNLKYEEFVKQ